MTQTFLIGFVFGFLTATIVAIIAIIVMLRKIQKLRQKEFKEAIDCIIRQDRVIEKAKELLKELDDSEEIIDKIINSPIRAKSEEARNKIGELEKKLKKYEM